jgi:hypothetical protein
VRVTRVLHMAKACAVALLAVLQYAAYSPL